MAGVQKWGMAQIWSCGKELRALQKLLRFILNRKKSRLKNQDTERTWTSNPLLESIVIPALCDLICEAISI